jgi:hypothetical protein
MTDEEMRIRAAIHYTIELYTRNTDTADYDRHHDVFHPEAQMEVQGGTLLQGPDAIISAMRAGAQQRGAFEPGNFQRHHLTSVMIECDGAERASARIYVMVVTELGLDHSGGYQDEYRPVGSRWMIYRRAARMEWARPDSRFVRWLGTPGEGTRL